jgi:hypothetical protein
MQTNHILKLIDGIFLPAEAGVILMELINHKIKYHQTELFSNEERFADDLSNSKKRIEELKCTKEYLKEIIDYTFDNKLQLQIGGCIEIKIIENKIPDI